MNRVYRTCYFRGGNIKDAEDLTAQTFLKAYEGLHSNRHRDYFAAWIFSIARARVTDFYRKKKNELPLLKAHEIPDESNLSFQIAENEILDEVLDLINCLSEKDQELLRLRFVAELTNREIGVIFHRREDAVRKAIGRVFTNIWWIGCRDKWTTKTTGFPTITARCANYYPCSCKRKKYIVWLRRSRGMAN